MVCKEELKIPCCNEDKLIQTINTHRQEKSSQNIRIYTSERLETIETTSGKLSGKNQQPRGRYILL